MTSAVMTSVVTTLSAISHQPSVPSSRACGPSSRLAECVVETRRDIDEMRLIAPIVGHVGDGNFHVGPMIDMDNPQEVETARRFLDRLAKRALAMEGTCTGEHGVGLAKQPFLKRQLGDNSYELLRLVKRALDPDCLLNPGKIFD